MAIRVEDSAIVARPVNASGHILTDSFALSLSLVHVIERLRARTTEAPIHNCNYPRSIAPWSGLTVNSSIDADGFPYGRVLNYIDLKNFNCDATYGHETVDGVNISSVKLVYSSASLPLTLEALFELPDGSTIKEIYDKTNFTTNGTRYTTYYEYVLPIGAHKSGVKA